MEETAVLEKSNPLPKFSVADREEPLDLLLYLIKKNEINIYDIPIAQITEQYMEYLDYAAKTDLENLTEFYALAADLLYIKSKMLLPVEVSFDDDEMEDPRQELVDKLIEYQKFKKLSVLMEEKQDESEWTFERKRIQRVLPFDEEELWQKVETWDLLNTFSSLISSYSAEKILDTTEEITVNEKIALMEELFDKQGQCSFTELIIRKENLLDIICAFMALLEAVKFKIACVYQNRMFGDIKIRPYVEDAEAS
ncbi:MAG: segregation/condensation protein A [Treponemataceae bacterium]|nr:segregation/condensation protein A [Spirochaetales bacterium]MDY6030947.1 segregation/condensation protein A [Treponemataceae bacterium]